MKIIIFVITFLLSGFSYYAHADIYADAGEFSRRYQRDIESAQESRELVVNVKGGIAAYEEDALGITSDFESPYAELSLNCAYRNDSNMELVVTPYFGSALTDTETWHVNGIKYQTNDLNFLRWGVNIAAGVILPYDKPEGFHFTPFVGYGFRLINFERTNFNILNIITSTETVNEKYYIHHADAGAKLEIPLTKRFTINAGILGGYVFYNEADNSSLGKIEGNGGLLLDGDLGLQFSLTDNWKLALGAFAEYQELEGGEKNDVIWPDNKLEIYGGSLKAQFIF